MHVLAAIALAALAWKGWDSVADPKFNAAYGWIVKTGLVVAAIGIALFLPLPWTGGSGEPDVPVSME